MSEQTAVDVVDFRYPGDVDFSPAFERALASGQHVLVPNGIYDVSEPILMRTQGQRIIGCGGHTSRSVIRSSALVDPVIQVEQRSCGVSGLQITSDASRRVAVTDTGHGLLVTGGDRPNPTSMSRQAYHDLYITDQPTDGVQAIGTLELSHIDLITVQDAGRHGFVQDGGVSAGYQLVAQSPAFMLHWSRCRALECAGNALILRSSQDKALEGVMLNLFQALGCGWDATKRISEYQIEFSGLHIIATLLDCEDQQYAESTTLLGNPKTPRTVPSKGVQASSTALKLDRPYFSSVEQSFNSSGGSGVEIIEPRLFSGTWGGLQVNAFQMDASPGFKFTGQTAQATGAANLLLNQSDDAQITIDAIRYRGLLTTVCDWQLTPDALDSTVSSGTLEVQCAVVKVLGEGGVADSVTRLRIASGVTNVPGLSTTLVYGTEDITLISDPANGLILKGGVNATLDASRPAIPFIYVESVQAWVEV